MSTEPLPSLPSAEEWARTTPGFARKRECRACAVPPLVRVDIETVLFMHNRRETAASQMDLSRFIEAKWGIKLAKHTLQNHFSSHTAERWL